MLKGHEAFHVVAGPDEWRTALTTSCHPRLLTDTGRHTCHHSNVISFPLMICHVHEHKAATN